MSENSAMFGSIKNNECNRINESCNNPWVIGISKSHPGQRYYFNTITGVSLWNINSEEMEKFLLQRPNGNQSQYLNFPEPKEPPPNKRSLLNHCQHSTQCSKVVNREIPNGFPINSTGISCKTCCNPINQLSLSLCQKVGDPDHTLILNNTSPQSQVPLSTVSAPLNKLSCENNFSVSKLKNLPERKTCCTGENPDLMFQDTNCHENVSNLTDNDSQWFETSTHMDVLDVSPLKVLAKSNCIDDKWYIIPDVSVYLQSLQFLRTVINSDPHCCLMVPQYVKVELENATKTHLKTKAYCANYFIYKLLDDGLAEFDESSNLQFNKGEIGKQNLIDCCMKLTNQNYFVILVTNDKQLKKCRLKINIPVFTVKELKDYLCRSSRLITSPSPEPLLIVPHNKKIKLTTPCATTSNSSGFDTTVPSKHNSTVVTRDQNIQISLIPHINKEQICEKYAHKRTAEAGVQTDLSLTLLEEMENVYKMTRLTVENDDRVNEKECVLSQSNGALLTRANQNLRKNFKLRRRKINNHPVSIDPVSSSSTQNNVNNIDAYSSVLNCLQTNDLAEVNQNSHNTFLASVCDNNETNVGDKSKNMSNSFLEPRLHDIVQSESNSNSNNTCTVEDISNNKVVKNSSGKSNIKRKDGYKQKHSPITPRHEKNQSFEDKNVMFEITNAVMEENLKRKSDEWVSRFVQIMEEALTQVLRKTSSLCLPPPWNMYEATECIRQKYKDDVDVSDASTKFLRILNFISDVKGTSSINISPTTFMELYSFGVYLIDALQGIFNTCNDLQIAAGSLTKLLSDIQNPDLDLSNIQSFQDMSQEDYILNDNECSSNKIETLTAAENSITIRQTVSIENPPNDIEEIGHDNNLTELTHYNASPNRSKSAENVLTEELNKTNNMIESQNRSKLGNIQGDLNTNTSTCIDKSTRSPNTSPSSYSLRSLKRNKIIKSQGEKNENKGQQSCPKSLFLSNLLLQESRDLSRNCDYEDIASNNVSNNIISSNNTGSSEKVNNYVPNILTNVNEPNTEPKIIRNFVVCSEFEDRLRNTEIQDEFDDYDIDDEEMLVDYNDTDEFSSNKSKVDVAEFSEFHNNSIYNPARQEVHCNKDDVIIYFTCFIKRIAEEIKDVSSTIYNFSTNYCDELSSVTKPVNKSDLREKAEQIHLHIDTICTALTRILQRDKDFNYNLKTVLNKTEFGNFYVDEDQMDVYGVFIESSLKQVYDLKRIIEDILTALED